MEVQEQSRLVAHHASGLTRPYAEIASAHGAVTGPSLDLVTSYGLPSELIAVIGAIALTHRTRPRPWR